MSVSQILSAIKDTVVKVISSGGNFGEVAAQTGSSAGARAAGGRYNAPGGLSSSALNPSTVNTITTEATHPAQDISSIGSAITSVNDFLSYIAWIFHPLNILRAVEFLAGMLLFYLGIRPYLTQGSPSLASTGAGLSRVVRSVTEPTPIGRARRQRQGRRMGSREGQRESSRMEARRIATRTERERSAHERAKREQRAKRSARRTNP